jgi:small subunit ribosomal protein S7
MRLKDKSIRSKQDFIYSKSLNLLMYDGKKKVAQAILEKSLERTIIKVKESSKKDLLKQIISRLAPDLEIKSRRIGNAVYQVPVPLDSSRKLVFGIRFLIEAARSRKEYTMTDKLAAELLDAYNGKGLAIKKKDDLHKQGESNKSFAHFNW